MPHPGSVTVPPPGRKEGLPPVPGLGRVPMLGRDPGLEGSGDGEGTSALNTYFTNYTFLKNAVIGATAGNYPASNFFPADTSGVGFVGFANGNYVLTLTSSLHNAASDGKDVGGDIAAIAAAISGATNPILPAPKNLRVQ